MGSPLQPKTRVAFVLIDGLGDVSLPRLGFKTPLQAAKVPNLDAIASAGVNGLMDPVEVGLGCGSDTAHLSLLGYDPRVYYRGRGAFESMGAGLAMSPGDIAFKVSKFFFTFSSFFFIYGHLVKNSYLSPVANYASYDVWYDSSTLDNVIRDKNFQHVSIAAQCYYFLSI